MFVGSMVACRLEAIGAPSCQFRPLSMLRRVAIAARLPHQLSGGHKQRVATVQGQVGTFRHNVPTCPAMVSSQVTCPANV